LLATNPKFTTAKNPSIGEPTVVKTSIFITTPDAPATFLISILRDDIERSVAKAAQLGFDGVDFLIGDTFDSRKEKALSDNTVSLHQPCENESNIHDRNPKDTIHRRLSQILGVLP
jgi:hypothetical protein